jgi:hypothetical protein
MERPSLEHVLGMAEGFREKAIENLERDGYLYPTAIVFAMKDPKGRAGPTVLFCPLQNDESVAQVRELAASVDAYAVAVLVESFMVKSERPDGVSAQEHERAVRRIVPSTDEQRTDVLWFQVEHEQLFGFAIWVADCIRDAEGKLHALEFKQWSSGGVECERMESPFVLLPRKSGAEA